MKAYLLAAALFSTALSGFAQAGAAAAPAPASSPARERLLGEIEAWRAMNLPHVAPPDPITVSLEPRLDGIKSAAEAASDDEALAQPLQDFESWKASLLQQKYAVASSRGLARGGFAQFSREETQMAEFSAGLHQQLAQAASAQRVDRLESTSLAAAVHDPFLYFDASKLNGGLQLSGGLQTADASVVAAPPALDPKDPARYAKVRQILISEGARPRVIDLAIKEAMRQNADPLLVLAVIQQESSFHTHATSGAGARGLMQIMPDTGRGLGVRDSSLLYDAQTNLHAGIRYLKSLWGQFVGGDMSSLAGENPFYSHEIKAAVAAYNAGPGAVRKYAGVPPYRETQGYVKSVLGYYNQLKQYLTA